MQETQNEHYLKSAEDEIDLLAIIKNLLKEKFSIMSIILFFSISGVIFSFLLPNIYESRALLSPTNSNSSTTNSLQGYSSLAGLAGIKVPSVTNGISSEIVIEKLNTLSFFEKNILPNIFLPDLMAVKSWDKQKNVVIYNKKIYDRTSNTWIKYSQMPNRNKPSVQESFEVFKNKNLKIIEDNTTSFLTIVVKHQSPGLAKKWAELYVNQINSFYREKEKMESEKAIDFLNKQIEKSNISEVKQAISQLIQEKTKHLALIEANEFYVYEYIDPPVIMESKSEPKRTLIIFFSFILGIVVSILYVFIKSLFYSKVPTQSI